MKTEELKLTQEWDKTFPKSDKVSHSKVTFINRYGITLAADMYVPKNAEGKLPAIAVSGPFGAVKEQCSGLYAQTMAERGFLTIAFDPSFTGESGGQPRYMASPDINTEDFMAAVDFLSVNELVNPDRIGIIGICGWGGMAINTAALDTRIKATVASTMYDMTRVNAKGYFDSEDSEQARYEKKAALCAQRIADYKAGEYKLGGGVEPEAVRAILSHGYGICTDIKPETNMEKSLYTVDELTGIIHMKKFKDKKFAAKCDRELIKKGCEMLNMTVNEVADICINGMRPYADDIGLLGTNS